eukprot:c14877_g1_i1.p1 GENE.c14877_g1_i1~~c14877_g1_i1.p1  ORF type:complete len:180 (+),score=39.54 c14877_g1_i1:31-570(+)
MGIVFARFWGMLAGEKEYKICMVGLDNAGKTTVLYKLALDQVVETHPTIGSNVEQVRHNNVKLQVWDLGGQQSLRATWSTYYQNTNVVILVVDSTDRDRIGQVKVELQGILRNEALQNAGILVFANKQDLPAAATAAEISQILELHAIKGSPWHIQDCCALTGEGLEKGMDWVVEVLKT